MFLYQSYDDYKIHIEEKWDSLPEGAKKLIDPSRFSISNSSLYDSDILSIKITSKSTNELLLDIEMEIKIALYEEPWWFNVKIIFEEVREFNLTNSSKSTMPLNINESQLTVDESGLLCFTIKTLVNEDFWYVMCRDIKIVE